MITINPILQFYNPKLQIKFTTDTSNKGLGWYYNKNMVTPILYATTETEQNYCPIETGTLIIVFACKKFHQSVYGTHFIVEDFKESITKSPLRIQRSLLALQKYEFDLNYIPGYASVIADTLSRGSLLDDTQEITDTEMNTYIHTILNQYLMSDHTLNI